MGRTSTGAETCKEALRIELSYLLKRKRIQKGKSITFSFCWTDNWGNESGSIMLTTYWGKDEIYINPKYYTENRRTKEKQHYDYKIYLTTVPSNLGKGEVLYFLCPVSGKRCRVLYKAYGYPKWKSREAYRHRIYYAGQLSSKLDKANDRYWKLKKQIDKLKAEKHYPLSYNGIITKRQERIERLEAQREYWDWERWMPHNFGSWFTKQLGRKRLSELGC